MALNFCKIFSFSNQNDLESLVIVRGGEAPVIPKSLKNFEIIEFKTLDEARKFGREFVAKFGKDQITEYGLNVSDFYKYSVLAFQSSMGISEAYARPVTGILTLDEATRIADQEHFRLQDAVDECGAGFFAPEVFVVIKHNQ